MRGMLAPSTAPFGTLCIVCNSARLAADLSACSVATAGTAGIDGGVQVFVAASTTVSERLHLTDTQWLESNRSQARASAIGAASSFVGGGQGIDLARSCDMLLASTIKSFRRRSVWCARWSRDSDGSAPTLSIALGALLLNEGGRVDGIRFESYECRRVGCTKLLSVLNVERQEIIQLHHTKTDVLATDFVNVPTNWHAALAIHERVAHIDSLSCVHRTTSFSAAVATRRSSSLTVAARHWHRASLHRTPCARSGRCEAIRTTASSPCSTDR